VKRLLVLLGLFGAAAAAWRQWQARKADAELWQEATSSRDLR
jgi:hypothetical protein